MSEALKFKDLGNEQFKNKEWKNALDLYSKAIGIHKMTIFNISRTRFK